MQGEKSVDIVVRLFDVVLSCPEHNLGNQVAEYKTIFVFTIYTKNIVKLICLRQANKQTILYNNTQPFVTS